VRENFWGSRYVFGEQARELVLDKENWRNMCMYVCETTPCGADDYIMREC